MPWPPERGAWGGGWWVQRLKELLVCPRRSIEAGVVAGGYRARKARLLAGWGLGLPPHRFVLLLVLEESLGHLATGKLDRLEERQVLGRS